MFVNKTKLKNYGLGLGLRTEMFQSTLDFCRNNPNNDLLQWFEIVPENFINTGGRRKQRLLEVMQLGLPIIPHSVAISPGTAPKNRGDFALDRKLIDSLKEFFKVIKAPWFSDHLSFSYVDGVYLENLIPLPRTAEAVQVVADNIKMLQDETQLLFLLENPSYYSDVIDEGMPEADFMNAIMAEADCGLLLDVNNIYVNSINHDYDSYKFLDEIDVDRTVQVHIAGHDKDYFTPSNEYLKVLDTHGSRIIPDVFDLFDRLLQKTTVNAVLLERDSGFPSDFNQIVSELREVRKIMNKNNVPEVDATKGIYHDLLEQDTRELVLGV